MTGKNNHDDTKTIRLGLRPNINQFLILVLVNAFVGAMIGLEQTVVPLIGKDLFHIESNTLIVSFIASFGMVKAILNLFAGNLSDRWGRKKVLVLGWLFGLPVPFYLIVCAKLGLDYICKCVAWNKSRPGLVNDGKYEGRPSRKK